MANFVSSAMVLQRRYPISQFRQTHGTKLVAIACEKGPTSHSSWCPHVVAGDAAAYIRTDNARWPDPSAALEWPYRPTGATKILRFPKRSPARRVNDAERCQWPPRWLAGLVLAAAKSHRASTEWTRGRRPQPVCAYLSHFTRPETGGVLLPRRIVCCRTSIH